MVQHAILKASMTALAVARFPDWAPTIPNTRGLILTLHHVEPEISEAFTPNAGLAITPEFLDELITGLKDSGYRFVSLDELAEREAPDAARRIAVTLDDGYRDNSDHAWPVFSRHGVPFTIFVCPGFCDRTAELWWEALEIIVRKSDHVGLADEAGAPDTPSRTVAEKERAFAAWRNWLLGEVDETRQRVVIRKLAERHGVDLAALAGELVMDWNEVRRIAADPLCTIGAHTMTHPALARLPAPEALGEMRDSADRIEIEIGKRPASLAFPYGFRAAAGPREAGLAAQAGFAVSVTTRPGFLRAGDDSHGLPRVSVNGMHQSLASMRVLLTPALWQVRDRLARTR